MAKNRRNAEDIVHNILFHLGLIIEFFAILYAVSGIKTGKFHLIDNKKTPIVFLDLFSGWQIFTSILALIALMFHQNFIRNTFKKVNHVTTYLHTANPCTEIVPNSIMNSSVEWVIRLFIFGILASISGEIPYLLMVLSHNFGWTYVYENSSLVFIGFCSALCLSVLIWDIIVIGKEYNCIDIDTTKKKGLANALGLDLDKSLKENIKESVKLHFFISDFISVAVWTFINVAIYTKDIYWFEIISWLSLTYATIITTRLILKKNKLVQANSY